MHDVLWTCQSALPSCAGQAAHRWGGAATPPQLALPSRGRTCRLCTI